MFEWEGWSEGRAAPYHHGLGAITSRPAEALLDAAQVGEGSSMLDVATGPGYVAGRAAARGASVVGVDFSDEMLALAGSLHPSVSFRRADAGALPFADGSFDAVVAAFLMPHVSDLPAITSELARVVRPGGRLALATWDPEPETFTRFLFDSIAESGATPPASLPPGPPFFQYADRSGVRARCSPAPGCPTCRSPRSPSPTWSTTSTPSGPTSWEGRSGRPC